MKRIILFFIGFSIFLSCTSIQKEKPSFSIQDIALNEYSSFGGKVLANEIYDKNSMIISYETLKEGDTIDVAFLSTVNDVCEVKGCWMKVALDKEKDVMVRFKDYGFFVPKDLKNDTVIVQGRAYVSETAVDELKHLAEDAGKSEEEIAKITNPKMTYSFVADGVLIKQ